MLQRVGSEGRAKLTPIWAAYVRRSAEAPWRLEAISVLGATRARSLAEREHARQRVVGAEFRIKEFASPREIQDRLDD